MKILQINNCDTKGGAAKVAYRLSEGFIKKGHNVTYLVSEKHGDDAFVEKLGESKIDFFIPKMLNILGLNGFSFHNKFPFNKGKSFFEKFDIIHVHDLHGGKGYFNFLGLMWLSRIKPVVYSIHTMWPFTGNCLYSYGCEKWKKSCGKCPEFGKFPLHNLKRDSSKINLIIKRIIYKFSDLYPIGVSDWISNLARQGIMNKFKVETIKNGVNTNVFFPSNKKKTRKGLGIPLNSKVILFSVSGNSLDKRKGIDIILKALPKLKTKNIFLIPLCIIKKDKNTKKILDRYPSLKTQHITDDKKLNQLYNAADVVWHPSKADNCPLSIIEAMSSGTPVIASKVGGVSEIVTNQENGFLIQPEDPKELADKTDQFFSNKIDKNKMAENARKTAINRFSLSKFLDEHEGLYREILKK